MATADLQMLKVACTRILSDRGFQIPTEKAGLALVTAERLMKWIEQNKDEAEQFASSLLGQIRNCCSFPKALLCHTLKEKMWGRYYQLSASEDFRTFWTQFIQKSIGLFGSPIFYQNVTEILMEELIKIQFPVITSSSPEMYPVKPLDFKESNALRYCGGYLVRSLKRKIKKSAHPLKESMILCLDDLLETGGEDSEDSDNYPECEGTREWTNTINRGGLVLINDPMHLLLTLIELEVRKHFTIHNPTVDARESLKSQAMRGIHENEDVLFHWAIVSVNWDVSESEELFKKICEQYITIRGFSFASGLMEQNKKLSKRCTQKSKALRKTLYTE